MFSAGGLRQCQATDHLCVHQTVLRSFDVATLSLNVIRVQFATIALAVEFDR